MATDYLFTGVRQSAVWAQTLPTARIVHTPDFRLADDGIIVVVMTRSRVASEFDRYESELRSLEPIRSRDFDEWVRESRAVCWRHRNRLRGMWGLPLEPAPESAESADQEGDAFAVFALAGTESLETRDKSSGTALAPRSAMTIEELEKKMEARFDALEKAIEKRIIDENVETRRHFTVAAERHYLQSGPVNPFEFPA